MKKLLILLLIFPSLFLTGCLRTYYPMAYQTSAPPVIFTHGEKKFIGADITASRGSGNDEMLSMLKLNYVEADTKDYFNLNAHVFGYTGFYNVQGLAKYNGVKKGFGAGVMIKTALNFKFENFKAGMGLSAGFAAEAGEYHNFTSRAEKEGLISSENKGLIFMLNVFPVAALELSNSVIVSTQLNIGLPGFLSPEIVVNNDDSMIYWISWVPEDSDNLTSDISGNRVVAGFLLSIDKLDFFQ